MGGGAVLSTSLLALFQSCQEQSRLDWQPQFLSIDHAQLVSALIDTLLPKTDTPGGLDVKVDVFLDLFYAQVVDEAGQQQLVKEMDEFNESCKAKFGNVFHQLAPEQKQTVLQEAEESSPTFGRGVWGYSVEDNGPVGFYRSFKSLAIMAYCTSEEIGKNHLNYDPVPGPFQGCISLKDVDGVWSY